MVSVEEYQARIESVLTSLQIPGSLLAARALPLYPEAESLVVAEVGRKGREHRLIPAAADAWRAMRAAARAHGVEIEIVSAFRDVDRQADIVRNKLARGFTAEEIFTMSAPPGYSEHHTGRAVDIRSPDAPALEQAFEQTSAYRWLCEHAGSFSYFLSFPRDNQYGYVFEPWHWCFRQATA